MVIKKVHTPKKWWDFLKELEESSETDVVHEIPYQREIIPVIFVPGIMGSRLKIKNEEDPQNSELAWDPDDAWFMIKNYTGIWNSAAGRRKLLIGKKAFKSSYLEVDCDNASHNKTFKEGKDYFGTPRAERGWGGIMWGSYGEFLIGLQDMKLGYPFEVFFQFPVHAFGYNWTDTNMNSGEKLAKFIDDIIDKYNKGALSPEKTPRLCRYVILVTHSMGGLVARSACKLHGAEEKVLGVLHGVQPASGAPDAYWRMKGGVRRADSPADDGWEWISTNPLAVMKRAILEDIAAWTLGTDGKEVTATLGNMPGGLELLPNKKYRTNDDKHDWLQYTQISGKKLPLPNGDPYEEIYRLNNGEPYRLINPDWLDPAWDEEKGTYNSESPWDHYSDCLDMAEDFHDKFYDMEKPFHEDTYQFYVTGITTADKIEFVREDRSGLAKLKEFLPESITGGAAMTAPVVATGGNPALAVTTAAASVAAHPFISQIMDNRGGCKMFTDENDTLVSNFLSAAYMIKLLPPSGKGDGTVPESSGKFLKLEKGQTARYSPDNCKTWMDMHHQDVYKLPDVMTTVREVIENFARKRIKWGKIKD